MEYHYHVRAGNYGVLPQVNQVFATKGQALEGLRGYVNVVSEAGSAGEPRSECCSGWAHGPSVHFRVGRGQAYVEVTRCGDEACQVPWQRRHAVLSATLPSPTAHPLPTEVP